MADRPNSTVRPPARRDSDAQPRPAVADGVEHLDHLAAEVWDTQRLSVVPFSIASILPSPCE
jgi:hypothetical protein